MKKLFSVFLSLLLTFTLMPPIGALAQEEAVFDEYGIKSDVDREKLQGLGKEERSLQAVDEWVTFPAGSKKIVLNHIFKINFSAIATPDKIDAIVIEEDNKQLKINVAYENTVVIKVTPDNNLKENQEYVVKILLKNGKKYKKDFTTLTENPKDTAMREAEDAVRGLPALMDVLESDKDVRQIEAASVYVERAAVLKADVTALRKIIEELLVAAKPPVVTSKVIGRSTIQVTFGKAVDPSVALFTSAGRTVKSFSFNAKGTVATVEFTTAFAVNTKPTVTINGVSSTILSASVLDSVEAERVEQIEILSNKANRIGKTLQVGYIAKNQYGEDITETVSGIIAIASGFATATAIGGTVKITVPDPPSPEPKDGDKFNLTLRHKDIEDLTKELKVSMDSAVTEIKIEKELHYVTTGSKLTEKTNLDTEEIYLIIKATDGYGNVITDLDALNAEGAIKIVKRGLEFVNLDSKFINVPGDKGIGLKLTGEPRAGTMTVTLHAATGKRASHEIIVAEDARTDVLEIGDFTKYNEAGVPEKILPGPIVAQEALFIPIKAWDKEKHPINKENENPTRKEIYKDPISGIKYTFSPHLEAEIDFEINTDSDDIGLKIQGKDVHAGSYTLTVESSTGEKVTRVFKIEPAAIPTSWEWADEDKPLVTEINLAEPDHEVENPIEQEINKINEELVIVYDQHDRPVDREDYTLVVKTLPQTDDGIPAVTVNKTKITAVAIGTTSVTIGLKNGAGVIGEKTIPFKVTDGSQYVRYEVKPIGLVYDVKGADRALILGSEDAYNVKVEVSGVLATGYKDKVVAGTGDGTYTISENMYLNPAKAAEDGEIQLENTNFEYDGKTETKRTIEIVINQSGEKHEPEVTFSKVRPKVVTIERSEDLIRHVTASSFDTATLVNTAKFTATDQYGKKSKLLAGPFYQFVFKDGTEVDTKTTLAPVSGQQIFTTDNHQIATDFTKGSVFNAVLWVGTLPSKPVEVRTPVAYMPTVKAEAAKITKEKLSELKNGQNARDEALKLVGSDYTVAIKSSENAAISATTPTIGVVKQKADSTPGDVTFTVTHKTKNLFTHEQKVNVTVPAATEVIVDGPPGTAGDGKITGLEEGKKYFVTELITGKDKFYSVSEEGVVATTATNKTTAEANSVALESGINAITGLTNGTTYRVEEVAPTKVTVIGDLVGDLTPGDGKITGLTLDNKYVVTSGNKFYSVLENGTLNLKNTLALAQASSEVLKIETITGLDNGVTYKVEVAPAVALWDVTAVPGNAQVTINFTAPVGATEVKIQQKTVTTNWETLDSLSLNKDSTVAVISGLENGTAYQFRVVVTEGPYAGDSNSTAGVTPTAPITDFFVTNVGDEEVTMTFTAPEGATSVTIQQSTNGTNWSTATTETLNELSTTAKVTGLTNGTRYEFRIVVVGGKHAGTSKSQINKIPKAKIATGAIGGIAKPIYNEIPTATITATAEYTATIEWNPGTTPFGAGVYTATITISPKPAYTVKDLSSNFFNVLWAEQEATTVIKEADNEAVVTAIFPAIIAPPITED